MLRPSQLDIHAARAKSDYLTIYIRYIVTVYIANSFVNFVAMSKVFTLIYSIFMSVIGIKIL